MGGLFVQSDEDILFLMKVGDLRLTDATKFNKVQVYAYL